MVGFGFAAFVTVAAGMTFAAAVSMALRPGERTLAVFRHLSAATILALLSGLAGGLALAFQRAAEIGGTWGPAAAGRLFAGLAEAMVPALIGLAVLAVSWLLAALGLRRQA